MKRLEEMNTVEIPELKARLAAETSELKAEIKEQKDFQRFLRSEADTFRRQYEALVSENEAMLSKTANMQDTGRFVSVLIDADADIYYFAEEFISQGLAGGQAAADKLIEKVQEQLSLDPSCRNPQTIPIVVKAYANLAGLVNHFKDGSRVNSFKDLQQFWSGFSQRHPFVDFVDVGGVKEGADNKIRENVRFYIDNSQCHQIFLACVHDGGYVPFLSPYAGQASGSKNRVTLLSTGPGSVHPGIAKLGFKSTDALMSIFSQSESPRVEQWKRSEAAAAAAPSAATIIPERPAGPVAKKSASPAPLNWSTTAQLQAQTPPKATAAVPYTTVTKAAKISSPSPVKAAASTVPYNPLESDFTGEYFVENAGRLIPKAKDTAGRRLRDNNLIVHKNDDYDLIGKMKDLSLCQWHYVRSDCSNHRKERCKRNHDTYRRPLTAKEYDALWFLSRLGYCKNMEKNGHCKDEYCIYGHDDY